MRRWVGINPTRRDDQDDIGDAATLLCGYMRDGRRGLTVVDLSSRRSSGSDATHQVANQHGKYGGPMAPVVVDRKKQLQQQHRDAEHHQPDADDPRWHGGRAGHAHRGRRPKVLQ